MLKVINYLACIFWVVTFFACNEKSLSEVNVYQNYPPNYDFVSMNLSLDTLHFALNDTALHDVGSVNFFIDKGVEYLAIYDEESSLINVYQFNSRQLIKKILLKKYLPNINPYLTTISCRNFDSIFVSDKNKKIYFLDSSGRVKNIIAFPEQSNMEMGVFANTRPLILKDKLLYAGVCPTYKVTYANGLKQKRLMYSFDLQNNNSAMYYRMPQRYRDNLYDYHFFNYSYCINDRSNFVFSFPADSNIYETNLSEINIAYNGRSQFQQGDVEPEHKSDLENGGSTKQYRIRDAYGPIFFDPYRKRYLRLFMQKLTEAEFQAKKRDRKQSILIFNDSLQIIGESPIPEDISFSSLFFRPDGRIYVKVKRKDIKTLHFVRLTYFEKELGSQKLVQSKPAN